METVRVAFVDVPQLLRDLSIRLFAREGIDVQWTELDRREVPAAVAAGEVGVLVSGPLLADPEGVCRLLMSYPRLKALTVINDARCAALFELRPNRDTRELSPEMLADVVRAVRRDCSEELQDLDSGNEGPPP